MLDFVLTNKEGLMGKVNLKSSGAALTMKWRGLRSLRQQEGCTAKFSTLDFRKAGFSVFRDLLGRVALEGRGAQDSWIASSKLRRNVSQQRGSWVSTSGGLCG